MSPTTNLALQYDLEPYTSFLTSVGAAEIFWIVFTAGVVVTLLLALIRPKTKTRLRMRTRIYNIPAPPPRARPTRLAEMFGRRARSTAPEELDSRLPH